MNRLSYMSAHVLLKLNKLRKRDKIGGLQSLLWLFCITVDKFSNT